MRPPLHSSQRPNAQRLVLCGIGEGGRQPRCRPRHVTAAQNFEVRPKIAIMLLQNRDINITKLSIDPENCQAINISSNTFLRNTRLLMIMKIFEVLFVISLVNRSCDLHHGIES
ncbi:hypothetical protein AVEN_236412-1 [Araneus ventricosus]|uniref:Uncharacterized protein n=1 Tax=Araneus ventricosus TaxID=182803 RepID=A0A4Y2FTN5_ARAVE|nr:hypothetical protein AVEN_236412-1 [Araneus ventricosus]